MSRIEVRAHIHTRTRTRTRTHMWILAGALVLTVFSSSTIPILIPAFAADNSDVQAIIETNLPFVLSDNLSEANKADTLILAAGSKALPILIKQLEDPNNKLRANAAHCIGLFGNSADTAVSALSAAVLDTDPGVAAQAADSLSGIGDAASSAVKPLLKAASRTETKSSMPPSGVAAGKQALFARDVNAPVRAAAVRALSRVTTRMDLPEVKLKLLSLLKDPIDQVRISAAEGLGLLPPDATNTLSALTAALGDRNSEVRRLAAVALNEMGEDAAPATNALLDKLADPDVALDASRALAHIGSKALPKLLESLKSDNVTARKGAAAAISEMGADATPAIPDLLKCIDSKDENVDVKRFAIYALAGAGSDEPGMVVSKLVELLQSKDEDTVTVAALTIVKLGEYLQNSVGTGELSTQEIAESLSALKATRAMIADGTITIPDSTVAVSELDSSITTLNFALESHASTMLKDVWKWCMDNQLALSPIVWIVFFLLLWTVILNTKPILILKVSNSLDKIADISLQSMPIKHFFLISFFHHNPKVLDAWVASQIDTVRKEFESKNTVQERNVYIPMPVVLNGKSVGNLTPENLKPIFSQARTFLLICGEGGIGKTTLGCQIARWAMSPLRDERLLQHIVLPVLLEHDLYIDPQKKDSFLQTIRGQLSLTCTTTDGITDEFVLQLLKQKRLMVLLDHFSELSQETRKAIRPESPAFAANLLLVTSRNEEKLDDASKSTIKPIRIQGDRLSAFMDAYLTQRGKRELFDDPEYFDSCRKLSLIVGKGTTTILLAKLFAEQMIAIKDGEPDQSNLGDSGLPDNIPDLMLRYINELNRDFQEERYDNYTLHQYLKVVAWECLKDTFRPMSARTVDVLQQMTKEFNLPDADAANTRLRYLQERVRIVQAVGPSADMVRFTLDPVAEYLAAIKVVGDCGANESKWSDLLDQMKVAKEAGVIDGFQSALKETLKVKGKECKVSAATIQRVMES